MNFMIIFFILIPIILLIAIILGYRYAYNWHINDAFTNGNTKKWLSPIAVTIITFLAATIIIAIILTAEYVKQQNHNIELNFSNNLSATYTKADIEKTLYREFDGTEVTGYDLQEKQNGNFHYYVYHNNGEIDHVLPVYVILTEYTGKDAVKSHFANIEFTDTDIASSEGAYGKNSDWYFAVIDNTTITKKEFNNNGELIHEENTILKPKYTLILYGDTEQNIEDMTPEKRWSKLIDSVEINLE